MQTKRNKAYLEGADKISAHKVNDRNGDIRLNIKKGLMISTHRHSPVDTASVTNASKAEIYGYDSSLLNKAAVA